MNCRDFKDLTDSYLSNELLVETNHEVLRHLESCPGCRGELSVRRELRERLRDAVKNAPRSQMSPGFAARVKAELHEQAFGRQRLWGFAGSKAVFAGIACLLLVAIVTIVSLRKTPLIANIGQPAPAIYNNAPKQLWYEKASFSVVKNDAVDDHKHCALSHDLSEKPISLKDADRRFGTAANGLDAAVFEPLRSSFGDDAKFLTAHFCLINGRRFSHVVIKYKGKVVSVLLTPRDGGDTSSDQDSVPCGASKDMRVACFESGKYSVFVVSALSDTDNLLVAQTVAASVKKHILEDSKKV